MIFKNICHGLLGPQRSMVNRTYVKHQIHAFSLVKGVFKEDAKTPLYGVFQTWKDAQHYVCGNKHVRDNDHCKILERNKFCRIYQIKGHEILCFLVDTEKLTPKQAILTTKLGPVILTHSE